MSETFEARVPESAPFPTMTTQVTSATQAQELMSAESTTSKRARLVCHRCHEKKVQSRGQRTRECVLMWTSGQM
jgi:cytochrome c553